MSLFVLVLSRRSPPLPGLLVQAPPLVQSAYFTTCWVIVNLHAEQGLPRPVRGSYLSAVISGPISTPNTPFDKLIIDNYGVWRCKHIANFCYSRDELRDHQNATGENMYARTCKALLTKPFCKVAELTEAKAIVKSLCDPLSHTLDENNSDECGVC